MTEAFLKTRDSIKVFTAKSADRMRTRLPVVRSRFLDSYKRIRSAQGLWLFAAELAGVVLVSFGISLWSVPAALIIGGLVLVAAIEVRPHVAERFPELPVPELLLRTQAEQAAIVINAERYGLGYVDPEAIARLTPAECERVIVAARQLGASKT